MSRRVSTKYMTRRQRLQHAKEGYKDDSDDSQGMHDGQASMNGSRVTSDAHSEAERLMALASKARYNESPSRPSGRYVFFGFVSHQD